MIDKHDTILIQGLTDSFQQQLKHYQALREVVRQIMSRLVLSRGSLSKLSEGLQEKKHLVECIEQERRRIAEPMDRWQKRKALLCNCPETESLNAILTSVTNAIRDFLNDEEQLQKYLEGIMARTTSS